MTDIRQGRAIELDDSTPNKRISWLVRTLFKGKQREAARAFGISQAVLSKIMRDEQVAGQRVLAAVATHPRVNGLWLYTGAGEPLLPDEGELPAPMTSDLPAGGVGPTLPVAGQYLPGSPTEYPLLLTRLRMPVAKPDFGLTRYMCPVTEGNPIVHAQDEKVAAGDYLLMETDRRLWIDHPPVLNGRLMVIRLGGEHGPDLVLARACSQPEGGYLPLATFGVAKRIVKLALKTSAQGWSSTHPGRQGRAVELEDDPSTSRTALAVDTPTSHSPPVEGPSGPRPSAETSEPRSSEPSQEEDVIVQLDDITSICILIVRS